MTLAISPYQSQTPSMQAAPTMIAIGFLPSPTADRGVPNGSQLATMETLLGLLDQVMAGQGAPSPYGGMPQGLGPGEPTPSGGQAGGAGCGAAQPGGAGCGAPQAAGSAGQSGQTPGALSDADADDTGGSGSGGPAGQAAGSQSDWGKPLSSSLKMPCEILQNVVNAAPISSQDKADIQKSIKNVENGESLDCALNSLSTQEKCELEHTIAGAGFKPPEALRQYSQNPSKDYSPLRLDCALRNVENAEQSGGEQNTQAYKLEHLVPFFGPLVTEGLNLVLGQTASMGV